jgi:hypothetical protein
VNEFIYLFIYTFHGSVPVFHLILHNNKFVERGFTKRVAFKGRTPAVGMSLLRSFVQKQVVLYSVVTYSGCSIHVGTLLHSKSQYTTVKHSQRLFEHTYTSDPHGLGTFIPIEFFQQDLLWQSSNTHSHSCSQKHNGCVLSVLIPELNSVCRSQSFRSNVSVTLLCGNVCFHCCVETFVFIVALPRECNNDAPSNCCATGGRGYVTKET